RPGPCRCGSAASRRGSAPGPRAPPPTREGSGGPAAAAGRPRPGPPRSAAGPARTSAGSKRPRPPGRAGGSAGITGLSWVPSLHVYPASPSRGEGRRTLADIRAVRARRAGRGRRGRLGSDAERPAPRADRVGALLDRRVEDAQQLLLVEHHLLAAEPRQVV